ncbi:MAG TPA: TrbI/VirB10 family protein [Sphingomonas sp.]|nr:TrbI/VirB10 family protein [Sphingomonas sp.]
MVAAKAPADALNALPASYADVPRLGPPLPGDLGRPILEHQRAMAAGPVTGEASPADQAAATTRDRRAAELRAARGSALLVQSGNRSVPTISGETPTSPASVTTADASRLALDPDRDPNGQQRKADFVTARDSGGDVNEHRLVPAASPDMLSAGSVIAASLITGLRSDLPGLVIAQVTERVFDSATGRILLIPQGARLIGSYDSVVAFGQRRALIVWQRILLPDGSSIRLDKVPATDPSGYAGLADRVDFHSWMLLKGVAISTLLGVGASLSSSGKGDLVQAIRESTEQNVARAGDKITSRTLDIQPTITIRPGAPVRLIVQRDLILAAWRG